MHRLWLQVEQGSAGLQQVPHLLKQLTMALPERLPVMLAPARAMVLAVSLRLSRMAPILSMWLPLALRLPVRPPTLPSPMLGLCRASATDVVSAETHKAAQLWNST